MRQPGESEPMATDKNFIIKNGLTVNGTITGKYGGFDSDFTAKSTTALSEGNNLYYTTTRADSDFDNRLATKDTDNLSEGANLYYTSARADSDAKNAVSATDAGGDGSFTYSTSTGTFTYTGPSASDVRAHFSGGTGIDISSGVVSTTDSDIVHDNLSGFEIHEHINHTSVSVTAGDGMTGGGTIDATRT